MIHRSFNEFHLGDNLCHLHFLRHLAMRNPEHQFIHAVHRCHIAQLAPVLEGVANVQLEPMDGGGIEAGKEEWVERSGFRWRNVWKNAGGFWESHPGKQWFTTFSMCWFDKLAREMNLISPFQEAKDFLFDYPALARSEPHPKFYLLKGPDRLCIAAGYESHAIDFLIINSQPSSGQLKSFDSVWYFDPLIADLKDKGYGVLVTNPTHVAGVPCTRPWDLSVSDIGNLSRFIPHHVMVATGPMWPTLNRFSNAVQTRVVLLDHLLGPEVVNVLPLSTDARPGTICQMPDLPHARAVLKGKGLL